MILASSSINCLSSESSDEPQPLTDEQLQRVLAHSPIKAAPQNPTNAYQLSSAAAEFGQFLFFSTVLSPSDISCSHCHQPQRDWTDGRALAKGVGLASRHTPSLWNVGYNRWQFWDGRADTLWAQALRPIEAASEMGSSRLFVAHTVFDSETLRPLYEAVYGEMTPMNDTVRFPPNGRPIPSDPANPLNLAWIQMVPEDQDVINRVFSNVGKALEAFEVQLVSADSPFDRYVDGLRTDDPVAEQTLSQNQKAGLQLFMGKAQCFLCHTGPLFTDREFHNIGLPKHTSLAVDEGRHQGIPTVVDDPFNGMGNYSDSPQATINDRIRFVTLSPNNRGEFKTPSLRNIAKTAPYMHDGRFATLQEVVAHYNAMNTNPPVGHREESLLPLELTNQEQAELISFLESLTGSLLPEALVTNPFDEDSP